MTPKAFGGPVYGDMTGGHRPFTVGFCTADRFHYSISRRESQECDHEKRMKPIDFIPFVSGTSLVKKLIASQQLNEFVSLGDGGFLVQAVVFVHERGGY